MEDERRIVVQEKRWSAREEVEQDCSMHRTVEEEEVRGKVWGEGRGERERNWRNGGRRRVGKDVGDEERRIEEDEEEEEEEEVKMVQLGRHRHRSRR